LTPLVGKRGGGIAWGGLFGLDGGGIVCKYMSRGVSLGSLKDYLREIRAYPGLPPKKDRVWLRSCLAVVEEREKLIGSAPAAAGGRRPSTASGRTPNAKLLRRRITQGPPYKCPLLRELLWDWFVDMRRSVAASLTPKFMLSKAKFFAAEILKAQRASGCFAPLPKLDRHWLLRFKRDKGIVFRKPNLRYKCSREVMSKRLHAMWTNTFRLRALAVKFLGHDLSGSVYGIDEKPLHFNESGSKCTRTLEIAGAPAVRLKQNHAHTRERVSVMTMVTSSQAAVNQPGGLPVRRPRPRRLRACPRAWVGGAREGRPGRGGGGPARVGTAMTGTSG
jgi:hypothetical protein